MAENAAVTVIGVRSELFCQNNRCVEPVQRMSPASWRMARRNAGVNPNSARSSILRLKALILDRWPAVVPGAQAEMASTARRAGASSGRHRRHGRKPAARRGGAVKTNSFQIAADGRAIVDSKYESN